jgi:hypothetical protein
MRTIRFGWLLTVVIGLLALAVPIGDVISVASAQGPTPPWKSSSFYTSTLTSASRTARSRVVSSPT